MSPTQMLRNESSILRPADRIFFQKHGYAGPFRLLDPDRAKRLAEQVRRSQSAGEFDTVSGRRDRHLDLRYVAQVCRERPLCRYLSGILGPDFLLWRSHFFILSARGSQHLPWHQDTYRSLLSRPWTNVSVHLAITPSAPENCLALLPGTHKASVRQLARSYGLIARDDPETGTRYFLRVDRRELPAQRMLLKPGEFFVFHHRLLHRSWISMKGEAPARIALAMRVTTPRIRILPDAYAHTRGEHPGPVALAGEDRLGRNVLARWP